MRRTDMSSSSSSSSSRLLAVLLVVTLQCILGTQCFKLIDGSDLLPTRFEYKPRQRQLSDIIYPANRQGSLYDDEQDDSVAYQRVLAALAEEAAASSAGAASADDSDEEQLEGLNADAEVDADDDVDDEDLLGPQNSKYFDIEPKADPNGEETESHSSLGAGHQYVSGGAGEGKQYLQPEGTVDNKDEIKSDEDLPAYCDPPNPCPVGYAGEDCDTRPYDSYTAEFSKHYQDQQHCLCDEDHNECSQAKAKQQHKSADFRVNDLLKSLQNEQLSGVVAKKSPRIRRDVRGSSMSRNAYLKGEALKFHVAKKSSV